MSAKAVARVEAARRAAQKLEGLGFPKEAEDVRSVCRANSSYRTTMSQMHKDNDALRERLA